MLRLFTCEKSTEEKIRTEDRKYLLDGKYYIMI
jgi:hypothetical protein